VDRHANPVDIVIPDIHPFFTPNCFPNLNGIRSQDIVQSLSGFDPTYAKIVYKKAKKYMYPAEEVFIMKMEASMFKGTAASRKKCLLQKPFYNGYYW